MYDNHPLEYKLIKLISQDFLFLQFLYINNRYPSKNKKDSCELLTFPYLTYLNLKHTHDDYTEVFLLKKNTHLPRLLNLHLDKTSLQRVTNNFTKDVTLFNFGTLKNLDISYIRPRMSARCIGLCIAAMCSMNAANQSEVTNDQIEQILSRYENERIPVGSHEILESRDSGAQFHSTSSLPIFFWNNSLRMVNLTMDFDRHVREDPKIWFIRSFMQLGIV